MRAKTATERTRWPVLHLVGVIETFVLWRQTIVDFEKAREVLELTDARIRQFGCIGATTSHAIQKAKEEKS